MSPNGEGATATAHRPVALNVGLDPAIVGAPETPSSSFPDVDAETVERGIEQTRRDANELGLDLDVFLIDRTEGVESRFRDKLESGDYAIIVIGGGVRLEPSLTHLFEALVNCVLAYAPNATVCFNTGPDTTIDAIRRWWPTSTPVPAL
ncbi:hypothetical protein [Mycolicibacterium mengxianglii]|uniref:hypothetical protein n=1 Tax=Mycolicibacterium mengxianglii TaxID=2736649 RepID=UPI0018D05CEB|nr:hypothetical protein [Mycolicibacterium mengxianglii]